MIFVEYHGVWVILADILSLLIAQSVKVFYNIGERLGILIDIAKTFAPALSIIVESFRLVKYIVKLFNFF